MLGVSRPPYLLSPTQVATQLQVRVDQGLSSREAKKRLTVEGPNLIPRHQSRSSLLIFLDRFKDPLVIFLMGAAIISLILREIPDAIIISIAILLDGILSFFQVWRTERTLERLREHVQQTALVLRDGRLRKIPAEELAVGDVIEFRAGNKIPADGRIILAAGLRITESALTGESEDVQKEISALTSRTPLGNRRNLIFMGTTVTAGNGRAIVTAVGAKTEFGKIAQMLKGSHAPVSPLRRKLQQTGMWIAGIIIVLVVGITVANVLKGESIAVSARTAITLIVSAIPEDLTIILTVALTVGVIRILKNQGVVRELSSGETLGAATVICTDKTGTLTQGKMDAQELDFLQGKVITPEDHIKHEMQRQALYGFALASDAHRVSRDIAEYLGSATERTALAFVERAGIQQSQLRQQWRQRDAITFDAKWKYRAILCDHPTQGTQTLFVTGAPDVLLDLASHALDPSLDPTPLTDRHRHEIEQRFTQLGRQAKRLVAVAVRRNMSASTITHRDIRDLTFLGVLTITDPIRTEVRQAIRETQAAGVAVKVVTGDYEETAAAVARAVGLAVPEGSIVEGSLLQDMSDKELTDIVDETVVFARVEPLDKQRIIRALQRRGHVVAMTGDGVNDAVALNSADIGVAMGSGKDIAKDAAKLVLLDDNFTTIVAAIREGRVIRDNVRKVIGFLLATNVAEVAIFIVSQVIGLPLPLLPAQILWINLVTDGTSDLALSLEPAERNVMSRQPEDPTANLINKPLILQILFAGLIMTVFSTAIYLYSYLHLQLPLEYVRTIIFCFIAVTALLSTWSYRSLWEPMWRRGIWQNPWLFASAGFSFALQLVAIYVPSFQRFFGTVPLRGSDWLVIVGLAAIAALSLEIRKFFLTMPNSGNLTQQRARLAAHRRHAKLLQLEPPQR